jgi:hypothetical protein
VFWVEIWELLGNEMPFVSLELSGFESEDFSFYNFGLGLAVSLGLVLGAYLYRIETFYLTSLYVFFGLFVMFLYTGTSIFLMPFIYLCGIASLVVLFYTGIKLKFHFSDVAFDDKLKTFNEKIENYRFALEQFKGSANSGKKAFLEFLKTSKYYNLKNNFYDDAEQFANEIQAWGYLYRERQQKNSLTNVGMMWHAYQTKVLFKIDQFKTLDKFF